MAFEGSSAIQLLDLDDKATDEERGPAPYPLGDESEEDAYATYSRALFDERREAMEPLYVTWVQNLLFLAGLQWWKYDFTSASFRPIPKKSWQEHPVRNLLVPFFKFVMAKLTKNRPRTTCVPASTDPDDIHAAELGDDVLKAKWQELRLTKILRRAIAWLVPTGNAFIAPYWNTSSGILEPLVAIVEGEATDEFGNPEIDMMTGMPIIEPVECPCDENGDPKMLENGAYDLEAEPHYVDVGEVGYKVFSPFQVFTDISVDNEDDVTEILIADPMTLREIRRLWPDIDELHAEDTSEIDRFDSMMVGMSSGADTHHAGAHFEVSDDRVPKALVLHYYERQTEDYPFGRHWVSVNRRLLERPGPLPDGIWPPIVHMKEIEVAGRYHGEATMTAAVGLQREYNEVNAQIKEHHNLLLRGKWLVPLGSNIRRGQITAAPGEVIQHTPGLKPEMADLKPLPQKVYEERDQILADFQMITGVHRVSMGDPPPGVTSGRAFLVLEEADDSDLGPLTEMLEESVAELGWLTLQIIQRFYDDERLIRVSGDNHRYRARAFRGADLSSIVDVEPQAGSAFPWSKSAKQSFMMDVVQTVPELFIDQETGMFDHERFRRTLPVGGEEAVGLGSDLDVAEALREEEEFEIWDGLMMPALAPIGAPGDEMMPEDDFGAGPEPDFGAEMGMEGDQEAMGPALVPSVPLPMPQPWQNHLIHMRQHARVLKSASFKKWPLPNQQALIAHWTEHSMVVAAQQAAAMEAEGDEDGPPDEGGGPKE